MTTDAPILVLGGSGFIGSQLVDTLLEQFPSSTLQVLSHKRRPTQHGVQLLEGSLENFDWNMLNENPPSHIFHLARINSSRFGKFGRLMAALKGEKANKRLLKHSLKNNWKSKIIYVSGSLMYGNSEHPIFENAPLNPISFAKEYSIAERPFLNSKQSVQMIRLPWVYGNASWFKSFYLYPMRQYEEVPCYGNGQNKMSFIALEDAAKGILFCGLNLNSGVYNLSIPGAISQLEFCSLLSKFSGLPLNNNSDNKTLKKIHESAVYEAFTSNIILDSNKRAEIPSSTFTYQSIEKMIESSLVSFLKNE